MKRICLFLAMVLAFYTQANAQLDWSRIPSGLNLRQSFQNVDDKPDPAEISATVPDSGSATYLINAALSYQIELFARANLYVFSEYHQNTNIEKEQHSMQLGAGFDFFTNEYGLGLPHNAAGLLTASANYNKDFVEKTSSLQVVADITMLHLPPAGRRSFVPNHFNSLGPLLSFQYSPSIGIEEDYRFQSAADSLQGSITRATAKLWLSLLPFARALNERLELFGNAMLKYDVINTTDEDQGPFYSLVKTGIGFVISKDEDNRRFVKFSISYNAGSDPLKGLKQQEYFVAAFNVKF